MFENKRTGEVWTDSVVANNIISAKAKVQSYLELGFSLLNPKEVKVRSIKKIFDETV